MGGNTYDNGCIQSWYCVPFSIQSFDEFDEILMVLKINFLKGAL
jgi:hypothetical protein